MQNAVLITGGTGLIGTRLTELLIEQGYKVKLLSRNKREIPNVEVYQWDIEKSIIDNEAFKNTDYIIHLAGSGIADEKWTDERKKDIINSRTESAQLLFDHLKANNNTVKAIISASGIGIYGGDSGSSLMKEDSTYGSDFLAETCIVWEKSLEQFETLGLRRVSIRIGIVLSEKGGALPKLIEPIKLGAGSALGSGKQIMSWIHIDDVCNMFIHALKNEEMHGAYNAVSPTPVSNETFTKIAAKVLHRWKLPFNVTAKAIQLLFGEMSIAILSNNNVSNEKVVKTGFNYKFIQLEEALRDLLIDVTHKNI